MRHLVLAAFALLAVTPARAAAVLEQLSPKPTAYVQLVDFGVGGPTAPEPTPNYDVTGVLAFTSGSALAGLADGCSAGDFGAGIAGAIAVVARGTCTFQTKMQNARAAGAVGVLYVNTVGGNAGNVGVGALDLATFLPTMLISNALGIELAGLPRGQLITMRLANGPNVAPTVPVPGAFGLMAIGAGVMGALSRRRRANSKSA